MEARKECARSASPISTKWRYLRLAMLFHSEVCGQDIISVQFMVLTTPIRLNDLDFSVQKALSMSLQGIKDLLNI